MASDAPLIGFRATLENYCLASDMFGALSRPSHLRCTIKESSFSAGLALKLAKFKAMVKLVLMTIEYCLVQCGRNHSIAVQRGRVT